MPRRRTRSSPTRRRTSCRCRSSIRRRSRTRSTPPPSTIYIGGRFMQAGPRTTKRTSELINTVVGAEGTNYGLDWKANIGRGESKVTNKDSNYLAADPFFDAVLAGQIDPTVTTNDQAVVDSLQGLPDSQGQVDGRVPQPAAVGRRRRHARRTVALCRRRAVLAREAERRSRSADPGRRRVRQHPAVGGRCQAQRQGGLRRAVGPGAHQPRGPAGHPLRQVPERLGDQPEGRRSSTRRSPSSRCAPRTPRASRRRRSSSSTARRRKVPAR